MHMLLAQMITVSAAVNMMYMMLQVGADVYAAGSIHFQLMVTGSVSKGDHTVLAHR